MNKNAPSWHLTSVLALGYVRTCMHLCVSRLLTAFKILVCYCGDYHYVITIYSRTCLERPPHGPYKFGLSRQVVFGDRFSYTEIYEPSARNIWALKTGGLSWQWSQYRFHCRMTPHSWYYMARAIPFIPYHGKILILPYLCNYGICTQPCPFHLHTICLNKWMQECTQMSGIKPKSLVSIKNVFMLKHHLNACMHNFSICAHA